MQKTAQRCPSQAIVSLKPSVLLLRNVSASPCFNTTDPWRVGEQPPAFILHFYLPDKEKLLAPGTIVEIRLTLKEFDLQHLWFHHRVCPVCSLFPSFVTSAEFSEPVWQTTNAPIETKVKWRNEDVMLVVVAFKNRAPDVEQHFLDTIAEFTRLDNPRTFKVLGIVRDCQMLGFLTEPRQGDPFSEHMASFTPADCWSAAVQVCEGLMEIDKRCLTQFELKDCAVWVVSRKPLTIKLWVDFSIFRALYASTEYQKDKWSAPEKNHSLSNAWCFGCLLIELFSAGHRKPWGNKTQRQMEARLAARKLPKLELIENESIRDIAKQCLEFDPDNRPSFPDIKHLLEAVSVLSDKVLQFGGVFFWS